MAAARSTEEDGWIEERLAIPLAGLTRAYAAPGMVSRCLAKGGAPYECPPWVRARILDPVSGVEVEPGKPGRLALFDLAGEGTDLHWRTDDLAVTEGTGFRIRGSLPTSPT